MGMKIRATSRTVTVTNERLDRKAAMAFGQQLIDEAEKRNRMFLTRKVED